MQTSRIREQQHHQFPPLALEQATRLREFHVQMQKECGQHVQPGGNDYDGKSIERNWRLVVVDLRVQCEKRPTVKKEQRQTQKKEDPLKIALAAVAENDDHPEKLQQRPRRVADEPNVEQ